jgi:hypothetical protein
MNTSCVRLVYTLRCFALGVKPDFAGGGHIPTLYRTLIRRGHCATNRLATGGLAKDPGLIVLLKHFTREHASLCLPHTQRNALCARESGNGAVALAYSAH